MRLRTVIFSTYVASSAIGFGILMMVMLWEVRPRYVESMRRTMKESAGILALMLEARINSQKQSANGNDVALLWRDELSSLEKAAGRLRVYVTDKHGIVLADSNGGRDVGADYTARPELKGLLRSYDSYGEVIELVHDELRVAEPVRVDGQIIAIVGVGRRLSSIQQHIFGARMRLVYESLVIAAAMIGVGWWVANRVTKSIERLTVHVRKLRDGQDAGAFPTSRAQEIAELAEAFEQMRVTLEGKAYVERYTHSLAHEIKAPLSSIRGAAELLKENPPPEIKQRFLENLQSESDRLRQIVDRLLELATLDARHGRLERESIDLPRLIKEIAGSAGSSNSAQGKVIRAELPDSLTVNGERFLIRQAIDNLLQNALDFSPDGGVVVLRASSKDGMAIIEVEDCGPGIPPYAIDKVFDRFFSLPRPVSGRKSTGLGLSLVKEVARLHGGNARLCNRDGGGARASLMLPCPSSL